MPTLLPIPCPSGPVVVSTPVVWPCSGCPGQRLSSWRKRRMSSSETAGSSSSRPSASQPPDAGQVEHGVKEHRGVAARQDEAVARRPERGRRVVAEELVVEHVGHRGQGHGRAGMAALGRLDGVHRQGADGVDGQLLDVLLASRRRHFGPRSYLPHSTGEGTPRAPKRPVYGQGRTRSTCPPRDGRVVPH